MDYIADFKYPEIVDTLLIPRCPVCNAGIDNISNLIVEWLHNKQLVVIQLIKGELLIKLVDMSDNRTLTYKER